MARCIGLLSAMKYRPALSLENPGVRVTSTWKSLVGAAAQRLTSNVSQKGPLPGTRVGGGGPQETIANTSETTGGSTLKGRTVGKAGVGMEDPGPKREPYPQKNTEETDGVAAPEGAEGPRDLAEKIRHNDEANTASMNQAAREAPDEFKSPIA